MAWSRVQDSLFLLFSLLFFLNVTCANFVYHSFANRPYCTPSSETVAPKDITELHNIVVSAMGGPYRTQIKPLGTRHSVTDIICTDGTPISMKHFNSAVLNPDGTATFGAGLTLREALLFLQERGRTLLHIPSYQGITIGGSTGTGAHGSSLKHPASVSELMTSLRIMDGTGTIREIKGEEVNLFRVHLGLLGILLDVTLETVPLYKMKAHNFVLPETILFDGTALEMAKTSDYLLLSWYPAHAKVLVMQANTVDITTPGTAFATYYTNATEEGTTKTILAYDALHEKRNIAAFHAIEENIILGSYEKIVDRPPFYTEDLHVLENPAVGYGWNLISGLCVDCPWLQGNVPLIYTNDDTEIACDISEWPRIIQTVKSILKIIPAGFFSYSGVEFRFHPNSRGTMAPSNGRKNGAVLIEFSFPGRVKYNEKPVSGMAAYQALAQALIHKHGGRGHWGKNGLHWHSTSVLHEVYDHHNLARFKQAMRKYDPFGVFQNKFSHRLLGIGSAMDVDPNAVHCALRDLCVCEEDRDCAETEQSCVSFKDEDSSHLYHVCRDKFEYHSCHLGNYNPYNMSDIFRAAFSCH